MIRRWIIPYMLSLAVHAGAAALLLTWLANVQTPPVADLPEGDAEGAAVALIAIDLFKPAEYAEVAPTPAPALAPEATPSELASAATSDTYAHIPTPDVPSASLPAPRLDDLPEPAATEAEGVGAPVGAWESRDRLRGPLGATRPGAPVLARESVVGADAGPISHTLSMPELPEASTIVHEVESAPRLASSFLPAPTPFAVPRLDVRDLPGGASSGVRNAPSPLATNTPPEYPYESRRRRETGTSLIRASVDAGGRVLRVALARTSGHERLDRAALDAVGSWRFRPATEGGKPVASEVDIPIEFVLRPRGG
ncbi:MAG: energy transducer TonB [Phycisphaerales bacterium]